MALVKYNNNSISTISSAGQLASGSLVPIKTLTASSSSTLSFVDGSNDVVLDSTYPIYKFEFINIHPATNNVTFGFQANTSGGSGYNETMTTTNFRAYHFESDSSGLDYIADNDQAQGTGFRHHDHARDHQRHGCVCHPVGAGGALQADREPESRK